MNETFAESLLNDIDLKQMTLEVLRNAFGHSMQISVFSREKNPRSTKFPTELLHIETLDNRKISLFVKHLDHQDNQLSDKDYFYDDDPYHEIRVYSEFLNDGTLPVPKYYGSIWNDAIQKHHLFLENVNGKMLKHREVNYWYKAARALARMHAYFAPKAAKLSQSGFFLTFDTAYYQAWVDRALTSTAKESKDLLSRLHTAINGFNYLAELLAKQPHTLVHNDLSSKNVIVDSSEFPARIVFVDWESAGIGFGLIDLIHLKYNRLNPVQDDYLCAEYFDELIKQGFPQIKGENPEVLLDACELFFTLYRIAHCSLWGESIVQLSKRIDKACSISERFDKTEGQWSHKNI